MRKYETVTEMVQPEKALGNLQENLLQCGKSIFIMKEKNNYRKKRNHKRA
ncbi:MAG: hypothetical protein PHN80_09115 [Hespellia sp.]|nr:hypothetical protein [Hespellia sp.]